MSKLSELRATLESIQPFASAWLERLEDEYYILIVVLPRTQTCLISAPHFYKDECFKDITITQIKEAATCTLN